MGRFFAKSGEFSAYKMYSSAHFALVAVFAVIIIVALIVSRNMIKEKILKLVRGCAVVLWILEFSKIFFNLIIGNVGNPNHYIPLYYCSITLYSVILSGWGKGKAKRIGDVFLSVGGVVGGIVYILCPSTTAGMYPAVHFITMQSYILHSIMVYLGILFVTTDYIKLEMKDVYYYALTVISVAVVAYIVNYFLDSNLMFVSKNFPGSVIEPVFKWSGKAFPIVITIVQAVPPFYVVYGIVRLCKGRKYSQDIAE